MLPQSCVESNQLACHELESRLHESFQHPFLDIFGRYLSSDLICSCIKLVHIILTPPPVFSQAQAIVGPKRSDAERGEVAQTASGDALDGGFSMINLGCN